LVIDGTPKALNFTASTIASAAAFTATAMSTAGADGLRERCGASTSGEKAINGDFGGHSSAANAENDLVGTMTVSTTCHSEKWILISGGKDAQTCFPEINWDEYGLNPPDEAFDDYEEPSNERMHLS
jgi:hypothetical protein